MKLFTPEISWHERDPIYTAAFHPIRKNILATAGVNGILRLWEIRATRDDKIDVEFLANLKRHTKGVNVIRWNHDGSIIASAGDEGVILLWNENDIKNQKTLDNDDDESKENWFAFKTLRGHLEDILDLCWSRDGTILISGSIDNSAIVWNVSNGNKIAILKEPKGFVQGVTYDPLGNYYAIMSTDRSLRFYSTNSHKCIFNVNRITINQENGEPHVTRLYHDDTMKSFFRRLCFSFDGNFIFTPAGCLEFPDKVQNVSFIFTRGCLNKPCVYIPHEKPSIAIAVCPLKFQLMKEDDKNEEVEPKKIDNLFVLPYRLIFAIATEDSIYFYDTQHMIPFGLVSGIHYSNLTDLTWSNDGLILTVSSIDGFSTFVIFKENELGEIYNCVNEVEMLTEEQLILQQQQQQQNHKQTPANSAPSTPKTPKLETAEKRNDQNRIKTLFANISSKIKVINDDNEKQNIDMVNKKREIEDIDEITVLKEESPKTKSTPTITKSDTDNKGPRRIKLVPLNS